MSSLCYSDTDGTPTLKNMETDRDIDGDTDTGRATDNVNVEQ